MPAETTPAVARALAAARAFAAAAGDPAVACRHLFAGLTADPDVRPSAWLVEHGLELDRWRQTQPSLCRADKGLPDLPLDSSATQAWEPAARLARLTSADRSIGTVQLLVGVLDGG